MKKCQYANGKLHGTKVAYDEAGDKISEAQYDQGKLHGTCILYYKGGVHPSSTRIYEKSKLVSEVVHDRPKRSSEADSKQLLD